jgi:thiamine-monophosphate kinase
MPAELALLERIRSRAAGLSSSGLRLGIGDDCALIRLRANEELAVTTDLSIAGRHFRIDWHSPESIGHRALARGLSDLAAMGARPVAAFLSLALPRALVHGPKGRSPWIERFLDGFFALAQAHQTPLAGGDLAESPLATADIVLAGAVRRGHALLRSGARPGARIYVTGRLGGSAAGLALLARSSKSRMPHPRRGLVVTSDLEWPSIDKRDALAPHLFPQPRLAQGLWLARHGAASAAIDLSDGLSLDLARLCAASAVAAEVDAAALPLSPGATLDQALHGGEDYELLFTAPPAVRLPRAIAGVAITPIGRILRQRKAAPQVALIAAEGKRPLLPNGWEHFS